jgi:dUTP pyrophosphatase
MKERDKMKSLKIKKCVPHATLPTRAHADDAGLDLYALEDAHFAPFEGAVLRTGIAIALAPMTVGLVADRSSMAKKGLKTSGGVIDAGYRGEIHIVIRNMSQNSIDLKAGERIAQLLILPVSTPAVEEVQELDETTRGTKGFGSSGR